MQDTNFWENVRLGAEKLGVNIATFRTWKSRGDIPHKKRIPIYQALKGTDHEISLEQLTPEEQ